MESAGLLNYQRNSVADSSSLTPVKPRLGRFVDVYSPEHLNITPRPKPKLTFTEARDESPNFITPEKYIEVDFKCRTAKAQDRYRNVFSNCSFEGNQSFPRLSRKVRPMTMELETPTKVKQTVDLVRVDGPNGLRFNTSLAPDVAGSPAPSQTERLQQTINPSKAVFTIEPNTLKILIVNNKACSLLGYSSGDLCGLRFSDLLRNRNCKAFSLHEPEDCDASEDGTVVLLSGKVVELISKDGGSVQVSLWIRQLDNDGPCLVVAEPVNCKSVVLTVEADTGIILACEGESAAALFGAESRDKLVGVPLASLIPNARLPSYDAPMPKNMAKQKLTG
ncbi:PAS domain-containing serine/threonine-protein kinase-like [Spodoptera litura]|nr:PAS domain-containing serine/threonine-protein kinase-like [Spodoptera litura]